MLTKCQQRRPILISLKKDIIDKKHLNSTSLRFDGEYYFIDFSFPLGGYFNLPISECLEECCLLIYWEFEKAYIYLNYKNGESETFEYVLSIKEIENLKELGVIF